MFSSLLILAGLGMLVAGGEVLVRGAAALAQVAGISPAVVGLTIVAAGTSAPELVVSLQSAFAGSPDIALANAVGSNIFNIAAILGIASLVAPLKIHGNSVRLEWPVMFLALCQLHMLIRDGALDRLEGAFLLTALVVFVAYLVRIARVAATDAEHASFAELTESVTRNRRPRVLVQVALLIVGCALLVVGARALVEGSVAVARTLGMSERVIGLTVVAAGTSLPELVTSVVASLRGHDDIAVTNVLGSNIFNVFGIAGCTALIHPLTANATLIGFDSWCMMGFGALLFPLMWTGMRINRVEGGVLLLLFVAYIAVLINSVPVGSSPH